MIETLKKITFLRKINSLSFLQKKAFHGTLGIGLISNNINSYFNIFNSHFYYTGKNLGEQKIVLNDGLTKKSINLKLNNNNSEIINLKDYFNYDQEIKIISCRIYNLNQKFYVPYFYTTIENNKNNVSLLHSSSLGNSYFVNSATFKPEMFFKKNILNEIELILMTLFPFKKQTSNYYEVFLKNSKNKYIQSFKIKFWGDVFRFSFNGKVHDLSDNEYYRIEIKGPTCSNPYILLNSQTLFHI